MSRISLLAIAACLLSSTLTCVAQDIILAEPPLREDLLPRSKVSTDIVMGVMLTGTGGDGKPPQLAMSLPESWVPEEGPGSAICVRVTSKNGRYAAANVYDIRPSATPGRHPLDFNSANLDFLRDNEAAVRISRGTCQARASEFVPALWTGEEMEGLQVFLNAGGERAAVASDGPGDFTAWCDDVSEESGLKYTARCTVPLANLNAGGATALFFTVNRNRTAEHFQIDVVLPEG